MTGILVVEDDEIIGKVLKDGLSSQGHEVTWVKGGQAALENDRPWDLILLDLSLPDLDGVEVCRRLRRIQPDTVIVMLTARQEELDVILGLEAGADDYLTKPFRFTELAARIRAHLRRSAPANATTEDLRVGALVVDTAARRCLLGDVEVDLRAREFDLLARLAQDRGHAVSRESLMSDVWDENWFGSTKTLDVHVAALRRRLDQAAASSGVSAPEITTLRGHGYRLEDRH
ncbi:response regulator transcription factor [Actinopolymorpha rutila]|uniref:DNA-binding response OmpR family regulator n=1 Tax=Actinopolymorpha rutila TaxID=446787 RepID=A0A852ZFM0_9ACTN|nr:response regulator transcription factor [Actinopolymorpha rutila]NYH91113.1 DNA-binding response OmpR family regulator [Actinopolymorpha rutila]